MADRVLGVDACRAGWIGIVLDVDRLLVQVSATISGLVAAAEASGEIAVVAIDIPIGLPDRGRRRADDLARKTVRPRWTSVFITPVRQSLLTDDHAEAVRRNRELAGEGLSRQAFGLRKKIFEVERWAALGTHRVVEVHSEVSFARMAGAPLPTRRAAGLASSTGATSWLTIRSSSTATSVRPERRRVWVTYSTPRPRPGPRGA